VIVTAGRRFSLPRRRALSDLALVVSVSGVQFLLLSVAAESLPDGAPRVGWQAVALIVAQAVPLLFRRRWPVLVFVAVLLPNTVYYAFGFPPSGLDLPLAVSLYGVALRRPRRVSLTACGTILMVCAALWSLEVGPYWSNATVALFVYLLVFFSAAWAWGRYHRVKQQVRDTFVADLLARAEQQERDRVVERERAVADERRRIARELHDSLAHQLSVMVVQAAAARRVMDHDAASTRQALCDIEEAGRRGLELMPGLVQALRGAEEEPLSPQPSLEQVHELVERVRVAGLDVTLVRSGEPLPLSPAVDLSAYRVLQEALTNCLKHASGTCVQVSLDFDEAWLTLRVRDHGGTPTVDSTRRAGHGLAGMEERVTMFGGCLETGWCPDGGFAVTARLPVEARP
jgi:signal transduction histidine kinase